MYYTFDNFFVIYWNDKLEKTFLNIKTPGLNNLGTYVLKCNTYLVLIFTDLNKAQIYKMPYRNSSHQEIDILKSFDYLNVFKPNEHTEDYHIRRPNNENFLFEIGDKKYIYVGEKVLTLETNDILVKYSSEIGFYVIKFPFAYGEENIYFMLHQKYIFLQEYDNSTVKNEYQYLYKKDEVLESDNITVENEGIVEYGKDFINCEIIHSKQ